MTESIRIVCCFMLQRCAADGCSSCCHGNRQRRS